MLKKISLIIAIIGLAIISFSLSLITEFRFAAEQTHWIYLTSLISALSLVCFGILPQTTRHKFAFWFKSCFWLFAIIFLLQTFLRFINLYHLDNYAVPRFICSHQTIICQRSSEAFFKFKLYRFVTLSSLLFIKALLYVFLLWRVASAPCYHIKKITLIQWGFLGFLFIAVYGNVEIILAEVHSNSISTLQVLQFSRKERFITKMGGLAYDGWIQPYSDFINTHTPTNSIILIPSRSNTWAMVGNEVYLRWFTYPRKLVQLDDQGHLPVGEQYILIAQGDCRYADCGWPKFNISRDQINKMVLIDRQTLQETTFLNQDYIFAPTIQKWGIIDL